MRGVSLTSCVLCATLLFFFLSRPGAAADEDPVFAPQITYSEGFLEIDAASMDSEIIQNGKESKSTAQVLGERINLAAEGFVYHPRLLVFLTKFSEGLNQQSGDGSTGNKTSMNYEIRTKILPHHPYNLELFKVHSQAYNPGAPGLASLSGSIDQQGALFNYRRKPFSFHTGYTEDVVQSATSRADSKVYRTSGEYVDRLMANTASYSHSETNSSRGAIAVRNAYSVMNSIHFEDIRLDSIVDNQKLKQISPFGPAFEGDTFSWNEHLLAPLPWNFTSRASYVSRNENSRTDDTSGPRDEFNRSSSTTVGLSHRLYHSLFTSLNISDNEMTSSHGESQTRTELLSGTYLKKIPVGKLTLGIQLGSTESEHQGAPIIINETHSAALLANFSLDQTNVVLSSITIQVKDPVAGSLITLPQSGFLSAQLGNVVQITVLSVFPMAPQAPGFIYEFHVSYSLVRDQSTINTSFTGYSFKTDLFDDLASVYYNYMATRQIVTSGSVPGGPDRTLQHVVGASVRSGPYTGLIEYQDYESRLTPFTSKKTSLQYQKPISEDTSMSALLTYTSTDYSSPLDQPATPAYRVTTTQTDLLTTSKFPREHLALYMSASYNTTRSLWDSNTLMATANVTWASGLLSITGGARLNRMESTTTTSKTTQLSQYYYVIMTRKLF